MPDINEPLPPDVLDPEPHDTLAGNWTDDDGIAIDQLFEAPDHGPLVYQGAQYPIIKEPKVATRLLSRTVDIGKYDGIHVADPVQLFPRDLHRKSLIIQATGDIVIGSQKSDVYNNALINHPDAWILPDHTGALWVYAPEFPQDESYVSGYIPNYIPSGPLGAAPPNVYGPWVHVPPGATIIAYTTVNDLQGTSPTNTVTIRDSPTNPPGASNSLGARTVVASSAAAASTSVRTITPTSEWICANVSFGGTITSADVEVDLYIDPPSGFDNAETLTGTITVTAWCVTE